jgi:hypothetical protein
VGPDTSKNIKNDTPITPKSLRNLRAFLDATDWRCFYGLNLGRGPVARAAEEAFYAQSILGPRLIAFQLGNEPDAWRNRYRPAAVDGDAFIDFADGKNNVLRIRKWARMQGFLWSIPANAAIRTDMRNEILLRICRLMAG